MTPIRGAAAHRSGVGFAAALAVVAIALQISYPLATGDIRDLITVAVVAGLAITCLVHAVATMGAKVGIALLACTAGIGAVAEMIGVHTGVPFGCYDYADRLGPSVIGVPLVVAAAWFAGMYPITWIAHRTIRTRTARIALTAIAMVGWDMYLDPQMVADGMWQWCSSAAELPGLPNIPYTNFVGWLLVALVLAAAIDWLPIGREPARAGRDDVVPVVLFCWTWLGSSLAHGVFLDTAAMGWSWLYGLLGMGVMAPMLLRLAPSGDHRGRPTSHSRDSAGRISGCPP